MSDKQDKSNPYRQPQYEWGRLPSPVFRVGPMVGGPRLYSGPEAGSAPASPQNPAAQAPSPKPAEPVQTRRSTPPSGLITAAPPRPNASVFSGSLVPQKRRPVRPVEPQLEVEEEVAEAETVASATALHPVAPVEEPPMAALEPAPLIPDEVRQEAAPVAPVAPVRTSRPSLKPLWLAGAVVVVAGAAAAFYLTRSNDPAPVAVPDMTLAEPVEAVQPEPVDVAPAAPSAGAPEPVAPVVRQSAPAPTPQARPQAVQAAPRPVERLAPRPQPVAPRASEPQILITPPSAQPQAQTQAQPQTQPSSGPQFPQPTPAEAAPVDPDAPVVTRPQVLD